MGRDRAGLAGPHRPGEVPPTSRHRLRRAHRAEAPRHRRHRLLPGRDLPLRSLGPRLRPDRQAGRGDRHRCVRDPDRARAAEEVGHLDVYQRTAPVGDPSERPRLLGIERFALPPRARTAAALPPGDLLGSRELRARLHRQPEAGGAGQELALAQHPQGHRRSGAAQEGDAGLPDRMQAHPDLQRLLPRSRPGPTSTSSRTGSRR